MPRRPSSRLRRAGVLIGLTLCAAGAMAEDWTRFRGPNGSGLSTSAALPANFDDEGALLWSAAIPFGRSSPAIASDRMFLTGIAADRMVTLAIARDSGEILWWRSLERERVATLHPATDSATPSPVTDGDNVYAFFQESGLVSYDGEGRERWRNPLEAFRNYYGMAASPILVGDLVIVLCDQAGGSFLLAVDKDSGQEVWRQSRADRRESYSTPVLYPNASEPRMILVSGSRYLDAYDPESGERLWAVPGLGAGPVASPVIAGDRVFVVAPNHSEEPLEPFDGLLTELDANEDSRLTADELANHWTANHFGFVDFDGDGWLTAEDWSALGEEMTAEGWGLFAISLAAGDASPEIVWNYRQNAAYIPTPVVVDDIVYMVKDSVLTSLDAMTGDLLERGRLGAKKVYASPVAAADRLLISSLEGQLSLIQTGKDWEILSTHDLDEEIFAAPAIGDGKLYIRTRGHLLAFAGSR